MSIDRVCHEYTGQWVTETWLAHTYGTDYTKKANFLARWLPCDPKLHYTKLWYWFNVPVVRRIAKPRQTVPLCLLMYRVNDRGEIGSGYAQGRANSSFYSFGANTISVLTKYSFLPPNYTIYNFSWKLNVPVIYVNTNFGMKLNYDIRKYVFGQHKFLVCGTS